MKIAEAFSLKAEQSSTLGARMKKLGIKRKN